MSNINTRRAKRFTAFFVGVLVLCFAAVGSFAADVNEMAQALLTAEKDSSLPTPTLSKIYGPADAETGYQVQNIYVDARLATEKISGYKGAMTAAPLMQKFSATEPGTAVLFESGLIPDGGVINLSRKGIMLEEEIGFRFAKRIDSPVTSVEELKSCITTIFPAIEVPLVAFETLDGVIAFDMIAANVGSWGYIVGAEIPLGEQDLNAVEMKATCNGADYNFGKGSDALGDQWAALLWIVNNVVKHGRAIEPGQIVISGAMGAMKPAFPGVYAVDFGELGTIGFEVKAE